MAQRRRKRNGSLGGRRDTTRLWFVLRRCHAKAASLNLGKKAIGQELLGYTGVRAIVPKTVGNDLRYKAVFIRFSS